RVRERPQQHLLRHQRRPSGWLREIEARLDGGDYQLYDLEIRLHRRYEDLGQRRQCGASRLVDADSGEQIRAEPRHQRPSNSVMAQTRRGVEGLALSRIDHAAPRRRAAPAAIAFKDAELFLHALFLADHIAAAREQDYFTFALFNLRI